MDTLTFEVLDDIDGKPYSDGQFAVVEFRSGGYGVIDRTCPDCHNVSNNLLKDTFADAYEAAEAFFNQEGAWLEADA